MDAQKVFAERFEEHRDHLRAVSYRMLGSLSEADDAVQETWVKAARADTSQVDNLAGWLTTVAGRVCLDMLRSRKSRREEPLPQHDGEPVVKIRRRSDPETEALHSESVGLALLVVLNTLSPTERLAYVLHDMFSVPFADIAVIVERSSEATQRLASRARQRIRGTSTMPDGDRKRRHRLVEAFLHASRHGEFDELLNILAPDVIARSDAAALKLGAAVSPITGATAVAERFHRNAALARPALLDGEVGILVAPRGKVLLAMKVTFDGDSITGLDAIADIESLQNMEVALP